MSFPKRLHGGVRIMNRPSPINVQRLDQNAMPLFLKMQRNGMWLDQDRCRDLGAQLQREMDAIRIEVADTTRSDLDISSPDQVAKLLFEHLKLPTDGIKWTKKKTRLSVDDDALDALAVHSPVCRRLQDWRERSKIVTTYTGPLLDYAENSRDGRVRTRFKLTRVVSGRPSSSEPNLANIPARSDNGKRVRYCFRPQPPTGKMKRRVLVTADQSQIEMRLAAHEAADRNMIGIFNRRLDIHTGTASLMFKRDYDILAAAIKAGEPWAKAMRTGAKSAGFGVLYGITAMGLLIYFISQGALNWTEAACQDLIDGWFVAYPDIAEWLKLQWSRARRHGFVWDLWGRVRYVPEVRSVHENIRDQGDRNSGNTPIQGGAQGCMKIAMAYVDDVVLPRYWARGYDPWPLMQVYDEMIFEVEEDIAEEFSRDLVDAVSNVVELRVPILASSAISGDSWGALEK